MDDSADDTVVVYSAKMDVKSAFRLAPLQRDCWKWLLMKAQHPCTGEWFYFVDKCLPFGASISCAVFQSFSDALKFLVESRTSTDKLCTKDTTTNYLDDFLFLALRLAQCNYMVEEFLAMCEELGVPIAIEKTEWAGECIIFLGILLNGRHFILSIPIEKRDKAIKMIKNLLDWVKPKATVKELQELCGYLNFLCKAIFPGRTFIRRMYAKYSKIVKLQGNDRTVETSYIPKPHHHVRLDSEFKKDCQVWLKFLDQDSKLGQIVTRPMIDLLQPELTSEEIFFYSDVSRSEKLGYGCLYQTNWIRGDWDKNFIQNFEPSIEYLELFALCAGLMTWQKLIKNCRITIFCDNTAVCSMVNDLTSSCRNCMVLIRMLTLNGLQFNRKVRAKYVSTKENYLADALSRNQMNCFRRLGPQMNEIPDVIHPDLWPMEKIWIK